MFIVVAADVGGTTENTFQLTNLIGRRGCKDFILPDNYFNNIFLYLM